MKVTVVMMLLYICVCYLGVIMKYNVHNEYMYKGLFTRSKFSIKNFVKEL